MSETYFQCPLCGTRTATNNPAELFRQTLEKLTRLESEKGRLEEENEKLREGMVKVVLNDMAESLDKERKEIEDDRRRTGAYIEEQRRKRGSPL